MKILVVFGLFFAVSVQAASSSYPRLLRTTHAPMSSSRQVKNTWCELDASGVELVIRKGPKVENQINRGVIWTEQVPSATALHRLLVEASEGKMSYWKPKQGIAITTDEGSYKKAKNSKASSVRLFKTHAYKNTSAAARTLREFLDLNCAE